jgi:phage head maturation protease
MKTCLKVEEMVEHCPPWLKDAIQRVSKDAGVKTDAMELHRHTHSEKAKVNQLDPKSRQSLKYVSARTQDRDDEIVIPESIDLKEFRRYSHVLVNHNYSLLPIGSDEWIESDSYGIKSLTSHADTGPGTLADTVWILVRDGHLKASSIGFLPTSFTKPGARDWDHVANGLQSNWPEFSKDKAEKSISRIITGGVLLEHSFVSVPCNADAEMISVCKAMKIEGTIAKQLGWEMKDGILVTKAAAEPVPCSCDECGYVADTVVGSKCPECKTGAMKVKGKEKAIEVRVVSKGDVPGHEFHGNQHTGGGSSGTDPNKSPEAQQEREHTAIRTRLEIDSLGSKLGRFQNNIRNDVKVSSEAIRGLRDKAAEVRETMRAISIANQNSNRAEEYRSDLAMAESVLEEADALLDEVGEKSLKAASLPCTCDECGAEADCAPGSTCQESDCDGTMVADKKQKAVGIPCTCDGCGAEADCAPGSACEETDCTGKMRPAKKEEKAITEIKVVRPAPSVKVLFVPPSSSEIAQRVGDAVEKALSRRTGKIM